MKNKACSKGYPLTKYNAVLLCKPCNSSKGAKSPEDFYNESMLDELEHILGLNKLIYQEITNE